MSSGLYIANASDTSVNGTYNLTEDAVVVTNRIWTSIDQLYIVKFISTGTARYEQCISGKFMTGVAYYEKIYDTEKKTVTYSVIDSATIQPYIGKQVTTYPITIYKAVTNDRSWNIINKKNNVVKYTALLDASSEIGPWHSSLVWKDVYGKVIPLSIKYWDDTNIVSETSQPIIDEKEGTTTTITTNRNLITGDVFTQTSVVRQKKYLQPTKVIRYKDIKLQIGTIYRFQFVSDFKTLGYDPDLEQQQQKENAGIYRVENMTTYEDIVLSGIDLYKNLYAPLNLTQDMYETDKQQFMSTIFYKLVSPVDSAITLYVPSSIIVGSPDPSVGKYYKYLLAIDLGIMPEGSDLDTIKDTLIKVCEKLYGLKDVNNTLIKHATYESVWLAQAQVDNIQEKRKEVKRKSIVDLSEILELQKNNRLYLQNQNLKGRISILEQLLKKKYPAVEE